MPRTAAFAAAASRGFGEFTSGLALTTVTFTSSTTWTAPSYVSNLVQMVGRGSNASSDDYSGDVAITYLYRPLREIFSGATVATHDWSDIYNNLQAWIAFINTGTPGTRSAGTVGNYIGLGYSINSDNTYNYYYSPRAPGYDSGLYFQVGTGSDQSDFSVPSSGTITYANTPVGGTNFVQVGYNPVYLGGNGAASTGVGKTFPGGTYDFPTGIGGPAPTTTFTNVTVTPSSSYSIVVPSGGQIAISFYAPA
jgi:hypothetical protein